MAETPLTLPPMTFHGFGAYGPKCRSLKVLASFAFSLSSATLWAGATFTPHPDTASAPNYFSGTNCRVSYYSHINGMSVHMSRAKLVLNGETVADETYPVIGSPPRAVYRVQTTLYAMFDSTHFAPGDTVSVEMQVTVDGTIYTDHYDVPVKNKALLAVHPEVAEYGGDPVSLVSDLLGSAYQQTKVYGNWSPGTFVDDLAGTNIVYEAGHGAENLITAGLWIDDVYTGVMPSGDDTTTRASVELHRSDQIGSGNPPFNSTSNPAINFVYLDICHGGSSNDFIRFCYPYLNGYGYWLENQCVMAYNTFIFLAQDETKAQTIFGALVTGNVVSQARDELVDRTPSIPVSDNLSNPSRPMTVDDLAIYGDPNTRLESVYTGDDSDSLGWFLSYYP